MEDNNSSLLCTEKKRGRCLQIVLVEITGFASLFLMQMACYTLTLFISYTEWFKPIFWVREKNGTQLFTFIFERKRSFFPKIKIEL